MSEVPGWWADIPSDLGVNCPTESFTETQTLQDDLSGWSPALKHITTEKTSPLLHSSSNQIEVAQQEETNYMTSPLIVKGCIDSTPSVPCTDTFISNSKDLGNIGSSNPSLKQETHLDDTEPETTSSILNSSVNQAEIILPTRSSLISDSSCTYLPETTTKGLKDYLFINHDINQVRSSALTTDILLGQPNAEINQEIDSTTLTSDHIEKTVSDKVNPEELFEGPRLNTVQYIKLPKVTPPRKKKAEDRFICTECGETFPYRSHWLIHVRKHSGEKPYRCDECGKSYTDSSYLTIHKRSHSGERPYSCHLCGAAFARGSKLTKHLWTHSGLKPVICGICGKGFADSNNLARHKRTHTGQKPFECPVCGKRFARSAKLTIHQRSHTGERPFQCEVCQKSFTHSYALTVHRRYHNEGEMFKCQLCDKAYPEASRLTSHMKIHARQQSLDIESKDCIRGWEENDPIHQFNVTLPSETPETNQLLKRSSSNEFIKEEIDTKTGLPQYISSENDPEENSSISDGVFHPFKVIKSEDSSTMTNPDLNHHKGSTPEVSVSLKEQPLNQMTDVKCVGINSIGNGSNNIENKSEELSPVNCTYKKPKGLVLEETDSTESATGHPQAMTFVHVNPQEAPASDETQPRIESGSIAMEDINRTIPIFVNQKIAPVEENAVITDTKLTLPIKIEKNEKLGSTDSAIMPVLLQQIKTEEVEEPPKLDTVKYIKLPTVTPKKKKPQDRFICSECGETFPYKCHWLIHVRKHSGEKPYRCDVCDKAFTDSSYLTIHKRSHSGERPYACQLCGASFARGSKLTKHLWTHAGLKPVTCGICGKGFADSNNLARHKRTHTGEKPYECGTCGKKFARSTKLTEHKRTHTGERPYKCGHCEKSFASAYTLTLHNRRLHGEEKNIKREPAQGDMSSQLETHSFQENVTEASGVSSQLEIHTYQENITEAIGVSSQLETHTYQKNITEASGVSSQLETHTTQQNVTGETS